MQDDKALRPSMPDEPAAQDRWLRERMLEALLGLSTAVQQLTATVDALRELVSVLVAREPAE